VAFGLFVFVLLACAFAVLVVRTKIPSARIPLQELVIEDAQGVRLATVSTGRAEEYVSLNEIAPIAREAVVAAEDRRFYEHSGVDPVGIGRAVYQALRSGSVRQGGSTITQQYVKNVYVGNAPSIKRKIREAALAIKVEQKLSKDEILERYLNTIYFGRGAYGIGSASQAYFGKRALDLDLAEAAYLAALIRGPESTDATRDLDRATRRRNSVLQAMVETGAITVAQQRTAQSVALVGPGGVLKRTVGKGSIRYGSADAGVEYFVDYVRRQLVNEFGAAVVGRRGLRVRTTLDLQVQRAAQMAAFSSDLSSPDAPSAGIVVLDKQGHIRAMVGGRDWRESQVNLAAGKGFGGTGRPGGSSFKAFALAAALEQGRTLEDQVDAPATAVFKGQGVNGGPWKVRNSGAKSYGRITLREAMAVSANTAFAALVLADDMGGKRVVAAARKAGIVSDMTSYPSVVLGSPAIAPLELADAYLTFATGGERRPTTVVLDIRDAQGRQLRMKSPAPKKVFTPDVAKGVDDALRAVVSSGTGVAAARNDITVAGKTGTTSDFRDAWFVGYAPGDCCVIAIWVGYPEGQRAMTNVGGQGPVTGGGIPARMFAKILNASLSAPTIAVPNAAEQRAAS
jgi:penicillin-binding protein 1A